MRHSADFSLGQEKEISAGIVVVGVKIFAQEVQKLMLGDDWIGAKVKI